ncbi:hypothetical protein ABEB36_002364 [Hypothenemus hampei]|uniref:RFX-type winged-helix domain-containing protein n=1 Tax=Hypothenemus hampei TaxID=57062 RepID=A0ABD1F5G8_HYPHA
MEHEQWSPNYQQSVRIDIERTDDDKTDTKIQGNENGLQISHIKEDPDANDDFIHVKNEFCSGNVVISEKSRQTIQLILAQIKSLSQNDKYLLCLKLPAEITDIVDPFRQPLNPLGSRSEISRTIVWIKTHLEEDQNISLPKKEVYNEYEQFCDKNSIKPLSQADFGKVMKQVFPKVRARRLGQRGNSKYCYSGLRRRVSLEPPELPDLFDKPLSTEAPISQSSVAAAWLVIRDWAQQQLGVQFTSLQSLAHYLVRNCFVTSNSEVSNKVISNNELNAKGDETINKGLNKHREMQLQLQKKIQQRNEGKDRKRKNQASKVEPKPGAKKCRSHSVPASGIMSVLAKEPPLVANGGLTSGECSSSSCGSNSVSPTQGRTICDKSEFTQLTALPDFKSFQKSVSVDGGASNGPAVTGQDKAAQSAISAAPLESGKVAIPRLQQASAKGSPKQQQPQRKNKYKATQPRLQQQCDIVTYNGPTPTVVAPSTVTVALADTRSQLVQNEQENNINNDKILDEKCVDHLNNCDDDDDDDDFPLTRERLDSISNVAKDAMDEYLGTNNSQHEEELSKYFNANEPPPAITSSDLDQTSKLSTLRQLLEQNGISEKRAAHVPNAQHVLSTTVALPDGVRTFSNSISTLPQQITTTPYNLMQVLPTLPSLPTRRRVSFETPVQEETSVPPSPNTRSKNFSFTPISPGPHSPNSTQSKCSSTSASPFVSPRNTPVPRSKNQNVAVKVKVKKELDLTLEIPQGDVKNAYLAMSAPVSPMIASGSGHTKSMLQKLLNASSKVQYTPEYTAQNLQLQSVDTTQQFFPDLARSQSVPLGQMQAVNILNNIDLMKREQDFPDIQDDTSDNVKNILNTLGNQPPCDNNNIDTFNLDISNSNLMQYELNLMGNQPDFVNNFPKLRGSARSHSIDLESVGFDVTKCTPSRSVPNTPLPYNSNLKMNLPETKDFQHHNSSRSYPSTPLNPNETFVYVNSDCLINGTPIRSTDSQDIEFISNFEINGENNVTQLDSEFTLIENGEALMDESGILIQQGGFNGNIN